MDAEQFSSQIGKILINTQQISDTSATHVYDISAFLFTFQVQENFFPDPKRIIPPNTMSTMDFNVGRLNVKVDESGKIIRIYYG